MGEGISSSIMEIRVHSYFNLTLKSKTMTNKIDFNAIKSKARFTNWQSMRAHYSCISYSIRQNQQANVVITLFIICVIFMKRVVQGVCIKDVNSVEPFQGCVRHNPNLRVWNVPRVHSEGTERNQTNGACWDSWTRIW